MIPIKTKDEIRRMREGGRRLAWVMAKVLEAVKPGSRLIELDKLAEALIEKQKGKPSFRLVPDYHWASCINVNQGVVHGIPGDYRTKVGDIISIDIGMFYRGLHTDMARTIEVGRRKTEGGRDKFLSAGEKALREAIKAAKVGNHLGNISQAIENEIKKVGFRPVKALTGHGIGRKMHEEPSIPCYLEERIENTPKLETGMTLAIEIIYIQGKPDVVLDRDGWTVKTADGKLAGLFEETVLVTSKGGEILTRLD